MTPPVAKQMQHFVRRIDEQRPTPTPTPARSTSSSYAPGLLDPRVLHLLALVPGKSRSFLTTKEVGRICLLTSKSVRTAASGACVFDESHNRCAAVAAAVAGGTGGDDGDDGDDETRRGNGPREIVDVDYFWRCLCVSYYRGDETAVSALMEKTGMSAKDCFRVFLVPDLLPPAQIGGAGDREEELPPPPPLRYSPSDYVVIVQVWGGPSDFQAGIVDFQAGDGAFRDLVSRDTASRNFLFCEILEGSSIREFFDGGSCAVSLQRPVSVGTIRYPTIVCVRARVRLLRKPDGKIVELLHSKHRQRVSSRISSGSSAIDDGGEHQKIYKQSAYARWLRQIYPEAGEDIRLEFRFAHALVDDDGSSSDDDDDDDSNSNKVAYTITGFRTRLYVSFASGRPPAAGRINWPNNGFKFAHLIENMAEWED